MTTRGEDDPLENLLSMEYLLDEDGPNRDRRVVDLGELLETNPETFGRFLEQMTIEILSRLLRSEVGEFNFEEDVRNSRELPATFPVEALVEKAESRASEWEKILDVVPGTDARFRLAPRLDGEGEVVLGKRDWTLLAATGSSTSIIEVARALKIFEFAAAKKVCDLVQRGLIEFLPDADMPRLVEAAPAVADMPPLGEPEPALPNSPSRADSPGAGPPEEVTAGPPEEIAAGPPERPDEDKDLGGSPPTWVAVSRSRGSERSGTVLLDELHMLHTDEVSVPDEKAELEVPAGEEKLDEPEPGDDVGEAEPDTQEEDEIAGADLATRWKNLRRAKRGAHAAGD